MANKFINLVDILKKRRTKRRFSRSLIGESDIRLIFWSGQGITDSDRGLKRTSPSAGAVYPITLYGVFETENEGFKVLRYDPDDKNGELYKPINIGLNIDKIRRFCAGNIGWMATSKAVIVFVVDFEKIESRYSCKGKDYALIEIGHIAQNILLLAQTLGINTVPVGAFDREGLSDFFPTGDVYYMVFLGKN